MNVHAKFLHVDELKGVLLPVLRDQLETYGFLTLDVKEDETSEGLPVVRVVADVEKTVPAAEIFATLDAAHAVLRSHGDDRIVFLSAQSASVGGEIAENGEEDLD